jgi:prolipoprotein diacylglyceryltransferase
MEFGLLVQAFVGIGALYGVLWFEARRANAADCTRNLWDVALAAGLAGLVVGRLAAMLIAGTNPVTRPGDVLIVRGGVDTVWASLGALATMALLARKEALAVADGLSAAVLAGLAGWHAGCMVTDTCLGTPSDLPWALSLPGSEVTRHPVELYAALGYALAAGAVTLWRRRSPPLGAAAAAGLALAGAVRLATEPLRPVLGGGLGAWYLVATLLGLAAMLFALRQKSHSP